MTKRRNIPVSALVLRLMIRQKTTVRKLSKASGVSESTIRRQMAGKCDTAQVETLERLCEALGIETSDIRRSYRRSDLNRVFGSDDIPF